MAGSRWWRREPPITNGGHHAEAEHPEAQRHPAGYPLVRVAARRRSCVCAGGREDRSCKGRQHEASRARVPEGGAGQARPAGLAHRREREADRAVRMGLTPAARERHRALMDEDVKAKLTAAWRAAVARLIEAGYDRADVYETMISVALSGAVDRSTSNAVL